MVIEDPREAYMRSLREGPESRLVKEEESYPLTAAEEQVYQEEVKKEKKDTLEDLEKGDVAKVKQERKNPKRKFKTKRAEIFEAVMAKELELSNWLGENCYSIETNEYDDRINHTDLVVEWETEEGKVIRLAVDVTVSENPEVIARKEESLKRQIESGKLTTVKYFESEAEDYQGPIKSIPRVILGTNREGVAKLCQEIAEKPPRELGENHLQLVILEEIKSQLENQIKYASGLMMEQLGNAWPFEYKGKERVNLKKLIETASDINKGEGNIYDLIKELENNQSLIDRVVIQKTKKISTALEKQQEVLSLINEIIENKKNSLSQEAFQRANDEKTSNSVFQMLIRPWKIPLPPELQRQAALL